MCKASVWNDCLHPGSPELLCAAKPAGLRGSMLLTAGMSAESFFYVMGTAGSYWIQLWAAPEQADSVGSGSEGILESARGPPDCSLNLVRLLVSIGSNFLSNISLPFPSHDMKLHKTYWKAEQGSIAQPSTFLGKLLGIRACAKAQPPRGGGGGWGCLSRQSQMARVISDPGGRTKGSSDLETSARGDPAIGLQAK